jgi:RND superfamily putative drug exporter
MSQPISAIPPTKKPFLAKAIRAFAVPVIIFWLLFAAVVEIFPPQIDTSSIKLAGPMVPLDSPSQKAMLHIGEVFHESTSTSIVMVVLEAEGRKLDAPDHEYYDDLLRRLQADKGHVQYVMDLWGKKVTSAGAQSNDGKSAYVLVRLSGNIGEAEATESVNAVRNRVWADTHPQQYPNTPGLKPVPSGLKVYVTGPAALASDTIQVATDSMRWILYLTLFMIIVRMLLLYRSPIAAILQYVVVVTELLAARGLVSALANLHLIPISTFAANFVVTIVLGAGTDYGFFLVGRYREARAQGQSHEDAYYDAVRGVTHVILGSGFAVTGAMFCLGFTRLNYFSTMAGPCCVGMLLTTLIALTMGLAMLALGGRFGWYDPKQQASSRGWRKIGTIVVRWPVPVLAASSVLVIIGAVTVLTYHVDYDDQHSQPDWTASNLGFQAADRHFPPGKMNTEMLMVEADHDMRNPADMVAIERVAKTIFRVPGIAEVQGITRPEGHPLEHATLAYALGGNASNSAATLEVTKDNIAKMEQLADVTTRTELISEKQLSVLKDQLALQEEQSDISHDSLASAQRLTALTDQIRNDVGYLDDYLRPFRNYFYWETNCWELPWCWVGRSTFDMLDQFDKQADETAISMNNSQRTDALQPRIIALTKQNIALTEETIAQTKRQLDLTRQQISIQKAQLTLTESGLPDALPMGKAYDDARNDEVFYMPPSAFVNPDFKIGLEFFVSQDGKATRFIITHEGDALSEAGAQHARAVLEATAQGIKGTSLAGSKIYLGGAGSNYVDIQDAADLDFVIAAICAFALIFLIMLFITKSLGAALTIVATVAFSYTGAFGMGVLIWQHILHKPLSWLVLPISFIIIVAVGSDYNLMLISRYKEEVATGAGLKTALIRAMGSTGAIVTTAGAIFAGTMFGMLISHLNSIRQVGTTVGIGLLMDTLLIRTFVTPSIATLLGRWFWWPMRVRPRPVSLLRK